MTHQTTEPSSERDESYWLVEQFKISGNSTGLYLTSLPEPNHLTPDVYKAWMLTTKDSAERQARKAPKLPGTEWRAVEHGLDAARSEPSSERAELKPCPFCGGPVRLEEARVTRDYIYGERKWYGVVCRNTTNHGGSCCMDQVPSASKEAAIKRWNTRAPLSSDAKPVREWMGLTDEQIDELAVDSDGFPNSHLEFARAIESKLKEKNAGGVK